MLFIPVDNSTAVSSLDPDCPPLCFVFICSSVVFSSSIKYQSKPKKTRDKFHFTALLMLPESMLWILFSDIFQYLQTHLHTDYCRSLKTMTLNLRWNLQESGKIVTPFDRPIAFNKNSCCSANMERRYDSTRPPPPSSSSASCPLTWALTSFSQWKH